MFAIKANGDLEEMYDERLKKKREVVEDGKLVRVNLLMMDSDKAKQVEAKREAAYQKYKTRTMNAWKMPTQEYAAGDHPPILTHVENYVGRSNKVVK
jgi:hypothetical protein